jgi:hypothetical protein
MPIGGGRGRPRSEKQLPRPQQRTAGVLARRLLYSHAHLLRTGTSALRKGNSPAHSKGPLWDKVCDYVLQRILSSLASISVPHSSSPPDSDANRFALTGPQHGRNFHRRRPDDPLGKAGDFRHDLPQSFSSQHFHRSFALKEISC